MKIVQIDEFGDPLTVARCIDAPEPGNPDPDEVVVQTLAFPIHPADMMLIRGSYVRLPPLPLTPGIEASGRILKVGSNVADLRVGDLVLFLARQTWIERRKLKAREVVALGNDLDPLQLALLYLNPLTAWSMLSRPEIASANGPDKWIIQNAGNSSVGLWVDRLAPRFGLRVMNVVRRAHAFDHLPDARTRTVVVDGLGLAAKVKEKIGNGQVVAALDAISGDATARLAACVMPGGNVFVYGNLAGAPTVIANEDLLFRGVHVTGFSVTRTTTSTSREELVKPLGSFADEIRHGFRQEVEATYSLENVTAAIAHAAREGRHGKILVTPGQNGSLST